MPNVMLALRNVTVQAELLSQIACSRSSFADVTLLTACIGPYNTLWRSCTTECFAVYRWWKGFQAGWCNHECITKRQWEGKGYRMRSDYWSSISGPCAAIAWTLLQTRKTGWWSHNGMNNSQTKPSLKFPSQLIPNWICFQEQFSLRRPHEVPPFYIVWEKWPWTLVAETRNVKSIHRANVMAFWRYTY